MEVIFEEESTLTYRRPSTPQSGPLVRFLITVSRGRIQSEAAASAVLLGVAIVAVVLSVLVVRTLVLPPPAEPILSPYDG